MNQKVPPLVVAIVFALLTLFIWAAVTQYPPVLAYRLYLSGDGKDASLPWESLSSSWSEAQIESHFRGHQIRCSADYTGMPGASRVCALDVKRFNGVPAMYVNFILADDRLFSVAAAVPWWSHRTGLRHLVATYGNPSAAQSHSIAGIRLLGWSFNGGSSLFYNRDRSINPLEPNAVQWRSASACGGAPCIR